MNATIVLSCLLALGLIVVASIASLARRSKGVTAGRCTDDAANIAGIVAAGTAASTGAASCSAGSSTACS